MRPGRAGRLLRLVTAPSCPAREPEAAAQGALLGWAIFLVGELRAGHGGRARRGPALQEVRPRAMACFVHRWDEGRPSTLETGASRA